MKLQVLVATMKQTNMDLVKKMNIQTSAVFANQADTYFYEEKDYNFGKIKMITTSTKGVGLNRNIALLHADGDILLFSDDDIKYIDNYEKIIMDAFDELPMADAIIFNLQPIYGDTSIRKNEKVKRIRWWNAFNYGVVRMAVKKKSLDRENIMFNLNFGGGTLFSAGEDTLYISDMLKKGLKIFTYPKLIATIDDNQDNSSWFKGYNGKFFYDKGMLFRSLNKYTARLLCMQDLIRHKYYRTAGYKFFEAYGIMVEGIKAYRELKNYSETK